ncbi:phospho-N-acetylmuramoyl-pentapeptide-transferase [Candidatus Azambacteria bacterium]|nr:phospho-N-acetylmuramoyl-pentapeptide-transferase [Candidatus Azambacteria bacterium]
MIESFLLVKILGFSAAAFIFAILATPSLTHFLYKYKLGKQIRAAESAPVFAKMHIKKAGTPTMGGVLIWGTVLILSLVFLILSQIFPDTIFGKLNFLTRGQTYLTLGVLVLAAIVGLVDDIFGILKIGPKGGGLNMSLYAIVASIGAWWFYFKLGWDVFHVPFLGDFSIGLWYFPIFIFIIVATSFSVNETDGLDGLAGGVLAFAFASYVVIATLQGKADLAVFCAVIVGALVAFLWFNVHPARFFMGDTGSMSLGVTLGVIAMLTNTALLLPFFGFILMIESLSVIIQLTSKKLRGKKIWQSTPIHHHFEAIGWPETKVTMRFWMISSIMSAIGLVLFILDRVL